MITNTIAARILIAGLVCGFFWLGIAASNSFMEQQSYFAKNNK